MLKIDKTKLEEIFTNMLGEEFITLFTIDMPQIRHIMVFVKTTIEFIWGDRFTDDPAWDYLYELGYRQIDLIASKEIKGGLWYEYENSTVH